MVAASAQSKMDEPFSKRSNAQPTAFERKLASVRERKPTTTVQQPKERVTKVTGDNLESIRQWQRHYRRQFPQFVIYFDSVADDIRSKFVRQIQSLGAREEKFFSKAVTHVVTTRSIPPELTSTSPDDEAKYDAAQQKATAAPSQEQRKGTSLLDAHLQRRTQSQAGIAPQDIDPRKVQGHTADILSRARQLGIKIWALEKLQRMLTTILDADAGEVAAHDTRSHATASRTATKPANNADLEQLLRNEKVNGPADRDMTAAAPDVSTFRGCYVYIHDMDEKTKPVMVRDYPKPSAKENGKWPQFRLTGPGRCPFVDDPAHAKKLLIQGAAAKAEQELTAQRKTRAASAQQTVSSRETAPNRALTERQANLRRSPRKLDSMSKPFDPPKGLPEHRQSSVEGIPPLFGSAQQSLRGLPRMVGGEPIASGVQHSNVTSAIRSQYISSAAISSTAPGANYRVGDSKEVSALKRKVLERGANVPSNHSMPSSYMNDMRAAINNDDVPPPRAAKRRAQETLGVVHEHDERGQTQQIAKQSKAAPRKRKPVENDPKPGYCENCRDKFEDFDEVSRLKHSSERPFTDMHDSTAKPASTASSP